MRRHVPAGLILLAFALIFYRYVLFYRGYVIPWDFRHFHLSLAAFLSDSLARGELPLWDPYVYCGRPFYANPQTQAFYPPTVLAALVGGRHLLYAMEWQLVLHVFLAGVFTYFLCLRAGAGRLAALIGATVYELGGFFASQAQHLGAVNGAAWLPLAWLSVLELRTRWSVRWFGALSLAWALAILAGFPAVASVVIVSTCLLGAALVPLRRFLGAGALALALTALPVLPALELSAHSVAKYRAEWLGTGGGLPLAALVSLVLPNHYRIFDAQHYVQPWNLTYLYVYCGIAGLLLAVAGSIGSRTRLSLAFTALTLFSAVWMLGDSTSAGKAMFTFLPGFVRNIVYPQFALASFVLGMAVLASRPAWLERPAVAGAVLLLLAADLILTGSGRPMNTTLVHNEPGVTRDAFDGSKEMLERMRALVNAASPPFRVDTIDDSVDWAITAPLTHVPTASGYDPMALERLMQVRLALAPGDRWGAYFQVATPESPILDLLNVRYLLSRRPVTSPSLAKIADFPGRSAYENRQALPRFFLVGRVRRAATMEEAAAILRSPQFDPRREAVVEGAVELNGGREDGTVRVVRYGFREVVLEVESPAATYLVTSEAHYPGWRAFVDGERRSLYYTNVAFRGLPMPAGRRQVVMRFDPPLLWISAAIVGLAWLALGLAVVIEAAPARRGSGVRRCPRNGGRTCAR